MEFEVKAKGFTGSESNIGNPFSAYRILHIYIYSVVLQIFSLTTLPGSGFEWQKTRRKFGW